MPPSPGLWCSVNTVVLWRGSAAHLFCVFSVCSSLLKVCLILLTGLIMSVDSWSLETGPTQMEAQWRIVWRQHPLWKGPVASETQDHPLISQYIQKRLCIVLCNKEILCNVCACLRKKEMPCVLSVWLSVCVLNESVCVPNKLSNRGDSKLNKVGKKKVWCLVTA